MQISQLILESKKKKQVRAEQQAKAKARDEVAHVSSVTDKENEIKQNGHFNMVGSTVDKSDEVRPNFRLTNSEGTAHLPELKTSSLARINTGRKSNRWNTGLKIGGGVALAGGTIAAIKHGLNKRNQANQPQVSKSQQFINNHGKKVAAGTLAALGAGIGAKALLKHLRKKKVQE